MEAKFLSANLSQGKTKRRLVLKNPLNKQSTFHSDGAMCLCSTDWGKMYAPDSAKITRW